MAAFASIPLALLVQGIYTGLIGTISTVTMKACGLVRTLYSHKNPDVTKLIKELDIERRLKLIQSILNRIDRKTRERIIKKSHLNDLEKTQIFEIIGIEANLDKDPIEICLIYLRETIQEICNDLTIINGKIEKHNTKWFKNWRSLNIQNNIDNLKLNSNLLEFRFNDLTRVSTFLSNNDI